jgi:hypothetical protein
MFADALGVVSVHGPLSSRVPTPERWGLVRPDGISPNERRVNTGAGPR